MQHDFAEIPLRAGPPSDVQEVPSEIVESYRGRVPEALLEFWQEVGWCSYQNGYFWVCDPRMFAGVLAEVFKDDPEYADSDFVIFKYDAFGKLYGWSNRYKIVMLDIAAYNPVFSTQEDEVRPETPEPWSDEKYIANSIALAREEREYYAENDLNDFERGLASLGRLRDGEIYGYSPAFALGGSGAPETLIKAQIVEHLLMLVQFVRIGIERYVLDTSDAANPMGRMEQIRTIGPQSP